MQMGVPQSPDLKPLTHFWDVGGTADSILDVQVTNLRQLHGVGVSRVPNSAVGERVYFL